MESGCCGTAFTPSLPPFSEALAWWWWWRRRARRRREHGGRGRITALFPVLTTASREEAEREGVVHLLVEKREGGMRGGRGGTKHKGILPGQTLAKDGCECPQRTG